MTMTHWKAAALAALIGLAPMTQTATPALAGSVTIKVTPEGKRAEAVKKGLSFWSRLRDRRNRAKVDQQGSGNAAQVSQSGNGNTVGVFQRGSGHSATASQTGNDNTLGIFQFGKNTSTNTAQTGDGEVGLIFQGGW